MALRRPSMLFLFLALCWSSPLASAEPHPLVRLENTGGFAPGLVHLDVTIDSAGGVSAKRYSESALARLRPEELARLKDAIAAVKWASLPAQVRFETTGMDMPESKLTWFGTMPGVPRTVGMTHAPMRSIPRAPKALEELHDLLSTIGRAAFEKDKPVLRTSLTVKPREDGARYTYTIHNPSSENVSLSIPHFGSLRFTAKSGKDVVYDSEANKYYIMIALPPTIRVLKPGEKWVLTHDWNYHRNSWGSQDRSRVPGGPYVGQAELKLSGGKSLKSRWAPFTVPDAEPSKDIQVKLKKKLDAGAGTVTLTLSAKNVGKDPTTLNFKNFPTYEIKIHDVKTGKVVRRDSNDVIILIYPPPTPKPVTLKPGESWTHSLSWNFADPYGKPLTGTFRAEAKLFTSPVRTSNTVVFTYPPSADGSASDAEEGDAKGPGILDRLKTAGDNP